MSENLPVAAQGGEVALAGDATDAGIAVALQRLVAGLHAKAQCFDDIHVDLHNEVKPDGSSRSCFSFRCYKHRG